MTHRMASSMFTIANEFSIEGNPQIPTEFSPHHQVVYNHQTKRSTAPQCHTLIYLPKWPMDHADRAGWITIGRLINQRISSFFLTSCFVVRFEYFH